LSKLELQPPVKRWQQGFTLLELLVVIAVVGLLVVIAATALPSLTGKLRLEETAQQLSQNIQRLRARSTTTGNPWRLLVGDATSYTVEESTSAAVWTIRDTFKLPKNITLSNFVISDSLTMNTQGLLTFNLNGTVAGELRITNGAQTIRIVPTLVGAVKVKAIL
jgi:type II secretion system protein H